MKREDVSRAITEVALQVIAGAAVTLIDEARAGDESAIGGLIENFKNAVTHARACEHAMHDVVEHLFREADKRPAAPAEGDAFYRERLRMVIGRGSVYSERLERAVGKALDEIGGHYDTKRK